MLKYQDVKVFRENGEYSGWDLKIYWIQNNRCKAELTRDNEDSFGEDYAFMFEVKNGEILLMDRINIKIEDLRLIGETLSFKQSEMAKHYGKDPATITRWKKSQPEIYKAMKYYYEKEVMVDHIKEKI